MTNAASYPRLSAAASLSFLLTGVAPLSSRYGRLCDKGNHSTPSNNDGDEENDEDEFPHPTHSHCGSRSNSHSHGSSSDSSNVSDVSAGENGGDDEAHEESSTIDSTHPPVFILHARGAPHPPPPVHIVDDVVPCNLVPLLPRTHGQFGLVAQIVPCAQCPFPDLSTGTTLQSVARAASGQHERSLRGGSAAGPLALGPDPPGAMVEWTTGAVGYTQDTAGLWAEQRIVAARHYSLTPKDPTRGEPVRPAGTLQRVVREQLSRMYRAGQDGIGESELQPRFARVVEMSYASVESLDRAVKGHVHTADVCDALLDEAISFGIAPRVEPHKLALFHASLAHRVLLESQRGRSCRHDAEWRAVKLEVEEEEVKAKDGRVGKVLQEEVSDEMSVTETLFELILIALRDVLHRRIGVQYELLRILRVKALAATHQNQIGQYTCWLATIPSPVAVLNALAGSSLFGTLVARRWPACGHAQDERERKRAPEEAPGGMATRRRMRLQLREENAGEERAAPTEADLLEESYMTRFVAQMRRPGPPGNTAVCDEVALAETVRWFRKYRRTMTLRELDAFARRKP